MAAFFAMSWNAPDEDASAEASHVLQQLRASPHPDRALYESDGFALAHLDKTRGDASILPIERGGRQSAGALFGTLFLKRSGGSPHQVTSIASEDAAAICRTKGEALLSTYWGRYVLFLPSQRGMVILPDPSSAIPCFYCKRGKLIFAFSNLELCDFLDLRSFAPDLHFVRSLIAYDKIQTGETALADVHEIGMGQRVSIGAEGPCIDQVWDPRDLAATPYRPGLEDAAEEIRSMIDHITACWSAGRPNIQLHLSGGLDSAIVASALARANGPSNIHAVHIRLQSGDPSEAHYARSVADFLGLQMSELELRSDVPLPPVDSHPRSVRPYREFTGGGLLERSAALAGGGAVSLFTGQGGDHLFQQIRSSLGFVDFLQVEGISRHAGRELLNAARLSGQSVHAVLTQSMSSLLRRPQPGRATRRIMSRTSPLTRNAVRDVELSSLMPAWARDTAGLPPGKAEQVASLLHMIHVRSGLMPPRAMSVFNPLISQPIIELCLRLPVYLLCAGGLPRGLVRAAMKGRIPDQVRQRRSKGDASRFYMDQLTFNRAQLADALIDGELVSLGLLDRSDTEAFLRDETYKLHEYGRTLFTCYAIESWLRAWKTV